MSRSQHPHVVQDYLARIRYSNALPPPPFYPKFLDIPNTGLSSGLYTNPHYASRLAREQPLNIEADAELGMPIDLVGIKGVFDGDESAILFEDDPPPLHPKDRELLRPLNALGKPVSATTGVSFLRRTEYISSMSSVNKGDSRNKVLRGPGANKPKKPSGANRDDPISILRGIGKSFDIAYPQDAYTGQDSEKGVRSSEITAAEKQAWARPKHPSKPNLALLDAYPIIPDLPSVPETGAYMLLKYQNNPSSDNKRYDPRLDVALIQPLMQTPEEIAAHAEKQILAEGDPVKRKIIPEFRYNLYLAEDASSVPSIKRKFDPDDPDKDDDELYDHDNAETGRRSFSYKRLRSYETYAQSGNPDDAWNDNVAMVLHDGDTGSLPKAAYLYPIIQRTSVRAARPKTVGMLARGQQTQQAVEEEAARVDVYELGVRDMDEAEQARVGELIAKWDPVGAVATGNE